MRYTFLAICAAVTALIAAGCSSSGGNTGDAATGPEVADVQPDTAAATPDMAAGTADTATPPDAKAEVAVDVADARVADLSAPQPEAAGPDTRTPGAETSLPDTREADARAEIAPDSLDSRTADTVLLDGRSADTASLDGKAGDAAGCNANADAAPLVRLSPLQLKTLLESSEDPFLINVKGESIGKIPGTDAVVTNGVAGIDAVVGGDHCANIILYCLSGTTSQNVGNQLVAAGYQHVRDLTGGITAWKNEGYPTE